MVKNNVLRPGEDEPSIEKEFDSITSCTISSFSGTILELVPELASATIEIQVPTDDRHISCVLLCATRITLYLRGFTIFGIIFLCG